MLHAQSVDKQGDTKRDLSTHLSWTISRGVEREPEPKSGRKKGGESAAVEGNVPRAAFVVLPIPTYCVLQGESSVTQSRWSLLYPTLCLSAAAGTATDVQQSQWPSRRKVLWVSENQHIRISVFKLSPFILRWSFWKKLLTFNILEVELELWSYSRRRTSFSVSWFHVLSSAHSTWLSSYFDAACSMIITWSCNQLACLKEKSWTPWLCGGGHRSQKYNTAAWVTCNTPKNPKP